MGEWHSSNKSYSVHIDRQTNPTRFLYVDEKVTATELGIDGDWPTGEIKLELPIPNGADTIEQAILIHSFNIMNNLQLGFENSSAFVLIANFPTVISAVYNISLPFIHSSSNSAPIDL